MANHFEVNDPRGRKVVCTLETWQSHILLDHSEMDGCEELVMATIAHGTIYRDVRKDYRHVYYRRVKGKGYYIKVVVEFDDADSGEVITAFRSRNRKPGERKIWPTPKA